MSDPNTDQDANSAAIAGLNLPSGRARRWRRRLVWIALILLALFLLAAWRRNGESPAVRYKTQAAQRGQLTVAITATGNLEPTNHVEVGSELSGIVESVNVDDNDHVKVGQALAKLDTSKLDAQILQSKASLASARAEVLSAQATIKETRDELSRLTEVRKLSGNKAVSQHDVDAAQASLARALADEAKAKAAVDQSKAALEANQTDLSKTTIRSPINGVVLSRSIDPGQTVAASLQAPVLFLLAEDLAQMELDVNVDEADVGKVEARQEAVFTVDAYPDRRFPARITRVGYGSSTVDGVVTYKTVLNVNNSDLSLRPGMTATAYITVKKIQNAILAPNAAIRFTPPEDKTPAASGGSIVSKILPHPRSRPAKTKEEVNPDKRQQHVWTLRNGQVVAIPVTVGATDGTMTEITSGDVEPGTELIVDTVKAGQ